MSKSTVTVPAGFVNLLREALTERLANAAGAIQDDGHSHPGDGIDPELLKPFRAYCALLERIGCKRTVPAAQVEVNLHAYGWALESALREHLDLQRYLMQVPATPAGAKQRERAQRKAKPIEAFLAGLRVEIDLRPPAREHLRAAGVDTTDTSALYEFAARQAARGEPVIKHVPKARHIEMLRLRLVEGFTLREVGERTGVTGSRVQQLLAVYFGLNGPPPAVKERAYNEHLDWLRARIDDPTAVEPRKRRRTGR
jgi:hypothetical protein